MKTYVSSEEDRAFRDAFEACKISPAEFRHRDHLRLAYVYLCEGDVASSVARVRSALLNFLEANNVPPGKYHETMTGSWVMAVDHFMRHRAPADSFDAFIEGSSQLLNTDIMMSHYSKEKLFSDAAREALVAPDLEPIT